MKRDLFAELKEGFDALAGEREGKLTLPTCKVALQKAKRRVVRIRTR
jgi:putative transcriptional regulator